MVYPPNAPYVSTEDLIAETHIKRPNRGKKRIHEVAAPIFEEAAKQFQWKPQSLTPERISEIQKSSSIDTRLVWRISKKGMDTFVQDPRIKKRDLRTRYNIKAGAKSTDQESTGRCWIFAALNMLRIETRGALGRDFDFSHAYVAFWDKFERCNQFLESIIRLKDVPIDDRQLQYYLEDGIGDGGHWEFFVNVVEKYGVVPEEAMPETRLSKDTKQPNEILSVRLREWAGVIRSFLESATGTPEEYVILEKMKMTALREVYTVLVSCWGVPPTEISWENERGIEEKGTPAEFYVVSGIDLSEKIHICNLPQYPFNTYIEFQDAENAVGGRPVRMFNIDMPVLKGALRASIKDGKAVWLESSMAAFDPKKALLSTENYRVPEMFKFDPSYRLDKGQALWYRSKEIEHATAVIGCDDEVEGDKSIGPLWKVENSWGGKQRFLFMTDTWFDTHCGGVVVDKKYLPERIQRAMGKRAETMLVPPWLS